MKKFFLFLVITLSTTYWIEAQNRCSYILSKEASKIILTPNKILDIDIDGEEVTQKINYIPDSKGNASISTHDGELLWISNGKNIFQKGFQSINNGNVQGNSGSTQPALFVPLNFDEIISDDRLTHHFFLFTTDIPNRIPMVDLQDKGLNYSIINYSISNGYFVSQKNINLLPHCTEKIVAVKKKNDVGMWLIAHGWGDNNFYVFDATDSLTITNNPIVQPIGSVHDFTDQEINNSNVYISQNSSGVMKISPDGSRLALALMGDGVVEIFDFDNERGIISNPITLNPSDQSLEGVFGIEFSPEGNLLYVTATHSQESSTDNYLIQYDITKPDATSILSSAVVLNETMTADVQSLQLTPRRQILVSRVNGDYLGKIVNPDRIGLSCNYNEDAVAIDMGIGPRNLTSFPANFLDIPAFFSDYTCIQDETIFSIVNPANTESDNISWDFGDPDGDSDISDNLNPTHIYSKTGTYTVTLTIEDDGENYVYMEEVTINELPQPNLGDDQYIVSGSSIDLYPGEFYSYEWLDLNSTSPIFQASQEGEYIVEVEDINCCKKTDSINVYTVDLQLPNAINPYSENPENREFKLRENINGISDFEMYIFNRWGELLFTSKNTSDGWDGKYQSEYVPVGSYTYLIKFNMIDDNQQEKLFEKTGFITVVK